jgi:hypothetical protein
VSSSRRSAFRPGIASLSGGPGQAATRTLPQQGLRRPRSMSVSVLIEAVGRRVSAGGGMVTAAFGDVCPSTPRSAAHGASATAYLVVGWACGRNDSGPDRKGLRDSRASDRTKIDNNSQPSRAARLSHHRMSPPPRMCGSGWELQKGSQAGGQVAQEFLHVRTPTPTSTTRPAHRLERLTEGDEAEGHPFSLVSRIRGGPIGPSPPWPRG